MIRRRQKRGYLRPYVKGSWIPVEDELLISRAFKNLPATAGILLLHMLRIDKMLGWKCGDTYTGEFNLTYSEAERLGFSRATTMRAVQSLTSHGFVEIVVRGGLKSSRKTSSVYRIIERWRTWGGLQSLKELQELRSCGKQPDYMASICTVQK